MSAGDSSLTTISPMCLVNVSLHATVVGLLSLLEGVAPHGVVNEHSDFGLGGF